MKSKIFLILLLGVVLISIDVISAEITKINPSSVGPGEIIAIEIKPARRGAFHNIIYVYNIDDPNNYVDFIIVNCPDPCTRKQKFDYIVPMDFSGDYYFATFDYDIDDYELDYFTVIEVPVTQSIVINNIKNTLGITDFSISLSDIQNTDIIIQSSIEDYDCELSNVNAYLCDALTTPCDDQNYNYAIPLDFVSKIINTCDYEYSGNDYFPPTSPLGDWTIFVKSGLLEDSTNFLVEESEEASEGTLIINTITNTESAFDFLVSPEQGTYADIEISAELSGRGCDVYNVNAYLCNPLIITCDDQNYDYAIPLTFIEERRRICTYYYTGTDYFPFYEVPGDWSIFVKSGILEDSNSFIYAELKAIDYTSLIDFGTLNPLMWNTGVPLGLELINTGNMDLSIDWQSDGFSCVSPGCTDFLSTTELGTGEPTFQIDDDEFFAEEVIDETGLAPTYIIDTPNNFFPQTGLPICISDLCDSGLGEKTSTYYNLKVPLIERGVYQGDILVTLY